MDYTKRLQENFPDVKNVILEKEFGHYFLRIEIQKSKLTEITDISRKISEYLDETNLVKHEYYLDVFSSGVDQEIDLSNIEKYIDQYIYVELKKNVKSKISFEATLITVGEESITIKWNNKGRFQKVDISKENISKAVKTVKV